MRTLFFDAFSGASGDMILGALVDLGADFEALQAALAPLASGGFTLERRRVISQSIAATKIDVRITGGEEEERNFSEIAEVVRAARLPSEVETLSLEVFRRLCDAEAAAHGLPADRVHLHEAGALDAIADVCGAAWLLAAIAPGRIVCTPLNVGSGTLVCRHGTFPVPGPATARLLEGIPIYAEGAPGERVTPTGAAILATVVSTFGSLPAMVTKASGYGAGDTVFPDRPNVLRALLGETSERAADEALRKEGPAPGVTGDVLVLEATIDDMNPQNYGWLLDRALSAGALEVFFTPVLMKKERPGTLVTVLTTPENLESMGRLLFRETTTIGFRYRRDFRRELVREMRAVDTVWGPVRIKVSSDRGEILQAQPEFEDCRAIAEREDVPLKEVQRAALAAWSAAQPPGAPSSAASGRPGADGPDASGRVRGR